MGVSVYFSIAIVAVCLFVSLFIAANKWYNNWLNSDRDPETGAPSVREPFGRALIHALKAPRERRRQEREDDLRRLESVPPEERKYKNPYGKDIVHALLACVLSLACFFGTLFLVLPNVRETGFSQAGRICSYVGLILMGATCYSGLMKLIAGTAGYIKFRDYKRKHPGKKYDRASFELEMKSMNGGYSPSDFGK